MSVRPLISMYLLMLCAVATGCGTSTEPKAEVKNLAPERDAAAEKEAAEQRAAEKKAAEKEAAEEKAAANSYVKVKVEVELRGLLSCTDEAVTIFVDKKHKWVLDFGEDKEMRAKAKGLDGKMVLAEGRAILQYQTHSVGRSFEPERPRRRTPSDMGDMTVSVLDLGPKIAVKSLAAAAKE